MQHHSFFRNLPPLKKRKCPFPERPVLISLYGFAVAMYHLLKFRFKSLLAEEYKSLLSIPPPLLEVTVSRCIYYCLIGDWSWINWIGLHFQGKKLDRVFLSSACTLYKQSQEFCIILRTCRSGRLKGNILLATFIHGDCEKLFFSFFGKKTLWRYHTIK